MEQHQMMSMGWGRFVAMIATSRSSCFSDVPARLQLGPCAVQLTRFISSW